MERSQLLFADFGDYCAIGYPGQSPTRIIILKDNAEIGSSIATTPIRYWTTHPIYAVLNDSYKDWNTPEHRERFFTWYEETINEIL